MSKILSQKTLWALLAGISYVLCFPRFDMPWFSLLFLPCLLQSLHNQDKAKNAWALGFFLSSIVAWGGFHWIIYVIQNFGDLPLPAAIGLLLLYCLIAAPQMVAFLVIGFRFRYQVEKITLIFRPLFWAFLYVALEYLFHFLKIFPEHLGNTILYFLPLAQAASFGGVAILSFFPLWIGASIFYLRKEGMRAWPSLALSLALTIAVWVWGKSEIKRINQEPSQTFRVGLIQHNMEDIEKLILKSSSKAALDHVISTLAEQTIQLVTNSPADLILWPETSYPLLFPTKPSMELSWSSFGYANLVKDTAMQTKTPLLFGGYESDGTFDYNAGILLNENGQVLSTYRKVVLLFIGEYLPFTDWFPSLKTLNPQMGNFARGPGPVPIKFPWRNQELSLGVNICYEAILPEFMLGMARNGANLFVNLTKDSWFGNTFEPWQHFQLSALRSIEHRIPMVRVTNTGLSGMVLASGEAKWISDPFITKTEVLEVPLRNQKATFYTRYGNCFAWIAILYCICTIAWMRKKKPIS